MRRLHVAVLLTTVSIGGWTAIDSQHAAYAATAGPSQINAIPKDGQLGVYWQAVPSATGYNLYVNGVLNNTTPITTTTATITGLTDGTAYNVTVTAIVAGTESDPSPAVVSTPVDLSGLSLSTDLIPQLTSNTSASPIEISASNTYSPYNPWRAFDNTTQDSCMWTSNTNTGWLQIDFGSGQTQTVTGYSIAAKGNASSAGVQSPKNWVLEASDTGSFNGEETILDVVNNESNWSANEKRTYTFQNSHPYRYYRLNVLQNNGNAYLTIGEMELFGNLDDSTTTFSGTSNTPTTLDLSFSSTSGASQYKLMSGTQVLQESSSTTFTDHNLTPATDYTYTVIPEDATGNAMGVSKTKTFTTLPFQWAPTASSNSPTTVDLNYASNEPTAVYTVTRNDSASTVVYTGSHPSAQDQGLTPNTSYSYTIVATDSLGNPLETFVTTPVVTQQAPFDFSFTGTAVNDHQVDLSYSGNRSDVTYSLYRDGVLLQDNMLSPFSDTTVTPGTTYSYTLVANEGSTELGSKNIQVTTPQEPMVITLNSTDVQANSVSLSFQPSRPAASYAVVRNGQELTRLSTTNYVDTTVSSNTTYTYQIVAYDSNGAQVTVSNNITVTTPAPQPQYTLHFNTPVVADKQIDLSWVSAPDGVAVRYELKRNNDVLSSTLTTTSYTDTSVQPYTQNTYTITAFDANGNVLGTDSVQAQSFLKLEVYPYVMPTTQNNVLYQYAATPQNVVAKYTLKHSDGTVVEDQNANPYAYDTLVAGTSYNYILEAYDASGNLVGTHAFTYQLPSTSTDTGSPSSPTNPGYPTYPSMPGYPTYPSMPGYPTYPSMPGYPTYPGTPCGCTYMGMPMMTMTITYQFPFPMWNPWMMPYPQFPTSTGTPTSGQVVL